MPNKSLKELVESIKNWLSGPQAQLIPIPVRNDPPPARPGDPGYRSVRSLFALILIVLALPLASQAANMVKNLQSSPSETGPLVLSASGMNQTTDAPKNILFLGDSLTAGYGIEEEQAYPALIAAKINEKGYAWNVVNAGLSGETSSGGLRRINWLLRSQVDVLVLALGANDGLRGVNLDLTRSNLQSIIDRTREKYPQVKIVIAGMQVPPNLGTQYTEQFSGLFPELARSNNAVLIPFLLEDVAAIPELNLPDGIHPTPAGHQIMAATVWTYLEPLLR
jgi:acyl-CoA thioesterase-1